MGRDAAVLTPVPAGPRPPRAPAGAARSGPLLPTLLATLLAAAVLLTGWTAPARDTTGLLNGGLGVAAATGGSLPQRPEAWQAGGRTDAVLAWSRDRLRPAPHLPNDRSGTPRAAWDAAPLRAGAGTAAPATVRVRAALAGIAPGRGPPATR